MKEITSLTNELVKKYASLNVKKNRDEYQQYVVDGDHLVIEAYKQGLLDDVLFVDELPKELSSFQHQIKVTDEIMQKISNVKTYKNVIGICHYQDNETIHPTHLIALDDVQDPGNGGTLLRTALACNYDGMLLSSNSFDKYNDKFIRSTMGAFFSLPILKGNLIDLIKEYKKEGFKVVVGDLTPDSISMNEAPKLEKVIIVVSNEGNGPSKEILDLADYIIKIDMSERIESLNVSVAGSLLMYKYSNI